MAWIAETGSGSGRAVDYHDLHKKIVATATSQHVSAVGIHTPGTGYVTGDVVSINSTTHSGIYLAAKFLVTATAGAITALRILSSGAIGNRLASAVVPGGGGGTGYNVGDILELDTGTSREKAKVKVATVSGSAVATVTVQDSGGAYSVAPSNGGATTLVGPSTGSGTGCTLDPTMTGLVGLTNLALQGGTGSGGKVNIALTETGWTALRNTEDFLHNAVEERTTVLKGDATGHLTKPIVGMITWSFGSSPVRYGISLFGMRAHDGAAAFKDQDGISPGINTSTGVLEDGGGNILCDEDQLQEMDFWITANDRRLAIFNNNNVAAGATTDNAEYIHAYMGFHLPPKVESEERYPLFVGASARSKNVDPSVANLRISGWPEALENASDGSGWWYYRDRDSSWVNIVNKGSGTAQTDTAWPLGRCAPISAQASFDGSQQSLIQYYLAVGRSDRTNAVHHWLPAIGGTWIPIQTAILSRPGTSTHNANDTVIGFPEGLGWVTSSDDTGAHLANFAEDYLTIGDDRWRVFGNHVHHGNTNQRYHYLAVKEDI